MSYSLRPSDFLTFLTSCFPGPSHLLTPFVSIYGYLFSNSYFLKETSQSSPMNRDFRFAPTIENHQRGITSTSAPLSNPSVFNPISIKPSALTMVLIRPDLPRMGSAHRMPSFSINLTRI